MGETALEAGLKSNRARVFPLMSKAQMGWKGSIACLPPYAVTGGVSRGLLLGMRSPDAAI